MLIALVAVTHVFISHFAVGGGAFLVMAERRAQPWGVVTLGYMISLVARSKGGSKLETLMASEARLI